MIEELDNGEIVTAQKIYNVFQASYIIEAALLGISDFPPLKRSVADIIKSTTSFYGFLKEGSLAAVVEIEASDNAIDICSLVVDPAYFRQGIARRLLAFAETHFNKNTITVETGLANEPAIRLYQKFGFETARQWTTAIGIEKIGFIKTNPILKR